jgi:hypothetical protein
MTMTAIALRCEPFLIDLVPYSSNMVRSLVAHALWGCLVDQQSLEIFGAESWARQNRFWPILVKRSVSPIPKQPSKLLSVIE